MAMTVRAGGKGTRSVMAKKAMGRYAMYLTAAVAVMVRVQVRAQGLLEAALFRPQTGYYPSLIDEAAALWESLSQNHPFVDGNKRTAFAATYVFLLINGLRVIASDENAQVFVLGLYETNQLNFEILRAWLLDNTKPV